MKSGSTIGTFEIVAPLGAGGMGEVYRARDTRLDREVAIKVLPEHLTWDKERQLRFEREAKLLASLNHPNIAAIYGFETYSRAAGFSPREATPRAAGFSPREATDNEGATNSESSRRLKPAAQEESSRLKPAAQEESSRLKPAAQDEMHFLVLEYVEGETLGQRLKRGALPIDEALEVCKQIAEAVEAAHEKGVIHRDLKPGNVMVKPDGTVKVLDFGLAKAMLDDPGTTYSPDSPTVTVQSPAITGHYTRPGVILGTAAYMSPEQARGRSVDKRTDIWSFGVVLYECLTGKMLFRGESSTDTIGAILHKEPNWSLLPPATPPTVQLLLRRCLAKDRNKRLQAIGDGRIEIEAVLSGEQPDASLLPSATGSGVSRRAFGISLAIAVVLAVSTCIFAWLANRPGPVVSTPMVSLSVIDDSGHPVPAPALLNGPVLAIAPDGSRLAFLAVGRGQTKLFVRELSDAEAHGLPGTHGAVAPFFSPDGRRIGFMSQGILRTVTVDGAPPRDVCPAPGFRGGCWTEGDEIVFAASMDSALSRVPASGGTPRPLTRLDRERQEVNHRMPEALPGGRFVLFLIRRTAAPYAYQIGLVDVLTGESRVVTREEVGHARYADGFLFCSQRDGSVSAVPFYLSSMQVTGRPVTVLTGVRTAPLYGTSNFAIAQDGTLAYVPGDAGAAQARVVWIDREGTVTPALPTRRRFTVPRLSPAGRYLLVGIADPAPDIWRYDLKQDPPTRLRLTRDGGSILSEWSPDSDSLCFSSGRSGRMQMYRTLADGAGEPALVQPSPHSQFPSSWSPDGRLLAYMEHRPETGFDVWIKALDEESEPWPITDEPFDETEPAFSPDSKWVAYVSAESGTEEVYVKAASGKGGRYPVSVGGGINAVWRGDEIFYRRGDEMMVVKVTTDPEFATQGSKALFRGLASTWIPARMYDVDADGQRFIVTLPDAESRRSYNEIRVVTGWVVDLRRRLAGGSD
jgi:serine/threonine-protein kinase